MKFLASTDALPIHAMNARIDILPGAVLALLAFPLATHADDGPCGTTPITRVYDLKTDWSDTHNPIGAWSYHADNDGSLLGSDPFPWARPGYFECPWIGIGRASGAWVLPGCLEAGDVFASPCFDDGVRTRWTAPARGTISVTGNLWAVRPHGWLLKLNGNVLSGGAMVNAGRATPYDLASGTGGAPALLNIAVQGGDQVELSLWMSFMTWGDACDEAPLGLNLTITHTTASNASFAEDPIVWHQPLARGGASEDTDPSAGRTVKYRFKRGSTIPVQIHALGCDGTDVTSRAGVTGTVTVFADSGCDGAAEADAEPMAFSGIGGAGGAMERTGAHLKYHLDTGSLPATTPCYILRTTVTDTSTGEQRSEDVLLQAK